MGHLNPRVARVGFSRVAVGEGLSGVDRVSIGA